MKSKKNMICAILVLLCCTTIGVGIKISADKTKTETETTIVAGQKVINKTVENQDGSTTTTTTVTAMPGDYFDSSDYEITAKGESNIDYSID